MIFISYRREDSGDLAWSLADKLNATFGDSAVFLDRHRIEAGTVWRQEIEAALSEARVVLAIIGQRWLTTHDEFGMRRIDRDDDVLAAEISTALARGVTLIPLYVQGTRPLPSAAFPRRLAGLAAQQGIEFDIGRDLGTLVERLEQVTGLHPRSGAADRLSPASPRPWSVPDSIGPLFTGRADAVQGLRDRFLESQAAPTHNALSRQVIHGLGGVGKTRLAIEYAWEYQDAYTALLFVVGDTPGQLRRSVAELAAPAILALDEWKDPEEEVRMAAVMRWLTSNPGWLLIIDNADDRESLDAVQRLLASLRGGHVIITSRSSWWSKSVTRSELDVLPIEAARRFLLERTRDERRQTPQDEAVALELATELGGLALALEQAGAYIQNRDGGLSLADYLARWREGREQVRAWCDESVMHYARSVAITWETTTRALGPAALTLFRMLSWFAPAPIPRAMVSTPGVQDIVRRALIGTGFREGEADPEQALSELIAYSMTRKVDEQGVPCVGLHRVVLQIMRDCMPAGARGPTLVAAAELLVLSAPREAYRPEAWMDWRLVVAHAEAIWSALHTGPEADWNLDLMRMLALYYMGQERNAECIPLQREVLRLVQERQRPDDEVYVAMNDLALMVDTDDRESLFREALAGRIRVHGDESIDAAETRHNLGNHLAVTRPEEAESLLRQALATFARLEGEVHWRTLMTEMAIAGVLLFRGESEKGESLLLANVDKKKHHLGPDHPDTLSSISMLVRCRQAAGDWEGAAALQSEFARGTAKRYGADHDRSLAALAALAPINEARGDFEAAAETWAATRPLWERQLAVLRAAEDGLPPGSEALRQHAVDLNNCALGLRQCGLTELAEECLRSALAIDEQERPADDPKIPHRLMNLGTVLMMRGRLDEADEVLARAGNLLAGRTDITGPRVLFLQYVAALLRSRSGDDILARFKARIAGPLLQAPSNIVVRWEIQYLLTHLRHEIPAGTMPFLERLVRAMNDHGQLPALDEFDAWRRLPPLPAPVQPGAGNGG